MSLGTTDLKRARESATLPLNLFTESLGVRFTVGVEEFLAALPPHSLSWRVVMAQINCVHLIINASTFTSRDVASSPRLHAGYGAAMLHNTSIEYFPAPVMYNSKKPPIMLRFL